VPRPPQFRQKLHDISGLTESGVQLGFDDGSPASGRGWAAFGTAGRLVGQILIHKGDDSGFVAERD
jgi:hypothetical protein